MILKWPFIAFLMALGPVSFGKTSPGDCIKNDIFFKLKTSGALCIRNFTPPGKFPTTTYAAEYYVLTSDYCAV
jgi:hypothetical protein